MGGTFFGGRYFGTGGGGGGTPGLSGNWELLRSIDFRTLTPGTYTTTPVTIDGVEFRRITAGNLKLSATNGLGTTGGQWGVYLTELADGGGDLPSTYQKIGMVMDVVDGFGTYSMVIRNDPAGAGVDAAHAVRNPAGIYCYIERSDANGGNSNSASIVIGDGGVETTKRLGIVWEGHTVQLYQDREAEGVLGEVTPEDILYHRVGISLETRGANCTGSPSRLVPLSADGSTDEWLFYDDSNQLFWVKTLAIFGWNP